MMHNITQNAHTTDTAAEEAALTEQSERSAELYDREYTNSAVNQRARIHQLIYQACGNVVEAVTAVLDGNEVLMKSAISDMLEYKRDWRLAKIKLEASNRTVRWLRAQLIVKTNEAAQVAGGAL